MTNPPNLLLRPASLAEAQAMAEMSRDLIESGLGWRYTAQRVALLIGDAECTALLACSATGIHGFAIMQFGDERAHLTLLCVRPAQRRLGIARSLLDWLVQSAQVAGIASIQLEVRADNPGALAFYEHLGFVVTQTVPAYYGGHLAARRMVRVLRPDAAASSASTRVGQRPGGADEAL